MAVDVLIGLQWGDEGKGKIVDYIANRYDIVCRFQGGPNAGHTIIIGDQKFVLHTIPSGIFRSGMANLIGNGVVVDPITLEKEIKGLEEIGVNPLDNLYIARKAHLILPTHRNLDAASENAKGKNKIGSTLKGIGPCYMDKTGRNGLRVGDIFTTDFEKKYQALKEKHLKLLKLYPAVDFDLAAEEIKWKESIQMIKKLHVVNGEYFLNQALKAGKVILAEGAQGSMLDIDFGTYPFVTSSNTISAGVCNGLGIAPTHIRNVIGITKAYCTRVGAGPFPTELDGEVGEKLRAIGKEFGATTGRPRRCGWIDIPQLEYTIMLSGVTHLVITKLDVLNDFEELKYANAYNDNGTETSELPFDLNMENCKPIYQNIEGWNQDITEAKTMNQLPKEGQNFINKLKELLGKKVAYVSTGPDRDQLIEVDGF